MRKRNLVAVYGLVACMTAGTVAPALANQTTVPVENVTVGSEADAGATSDEPGSSETGKESGQNEEQPDLKGDSSGEEKADQSGAKENGAEKADPAGDGTVTKSPEEEKPNDAVNEESGSGEQEDSEDKAPEDNQTDKDGAEDSDEASDGQTEKDGQDGQTEEEDTQDSQGEEDGDQADQADADGEKQAEEETETKAPVKTAAPAVLKAAAAPAEETKGEAAPTAENGGEAAPTAETGGETTPAEPQNPNLATQEGSWFATSGITVTRVPNSDKALDLSGYNIPADYTGYVEVTCHEEGREPYKKVISIEKGQVAERGWRETSEGWRYVNSQGIVAVNSSKELHDGTYYFDEKGFMATDRIVPVVDETSNEKSYYYADSKGSVQKDFVFKKQDGSGNTWECYTPDGKKAERGWIYNDMFVNSDGVLIMDRQAKKVQDKYYKFEGGHAVECYKSQFLTIDEDGTSRTVYVNQDGIVAEGADGEEYRFVRKENGKLYCEDAAGNLVRSKWLGAGGEIRVNGNGRVLMNETKIVGNECWKFGENGRVSAVTSQFVELEEEDGIIRRYIDADGKVVKNVSRYLINGTYYDFDADGVYTLSPAVSEGSSSAPSGPSEREKSDATKEIASQNNQNQSQTQNTQAVMSEGTKEREQANAAAVTAAAVNQTVSIQAAGVVIEGTVAQTAAGSVNGNTITSSVSNTVVAVAEGQNAAVVSTAVSAAGAARSLLAAEALGATVQQTTVVVDGVEVKQNVLVYADGAQISQKSGADELAGFTAAIVSAEQQISSGAITVAQAYNAAVAVDLNSYEQVGAAVTYAVTAAASGSYVQMEQTNFAAGQELLALITDASGNVIAAPVVVGANGIVQYAIPGANCVVRFMAKKA